MPLTDDESRRLQEISAELHRTDRGLAWALVTGRAVSRAAAWRRRLLTVVVALLVVSMVVTGVALQDRMLCAVAWSTLIAALVCRGISRS